MNHFYLHSGSLYIVTITCVQVAPPILPPCSHPFRREEEEGVVLLPWLLLSWDAAALNATVDRLLEPSPLAMDSAKDISLTRSLSNVKEN